MLVKSATVDIGLRTKDENFPLGVFTLGDFPLGYRVDFDKRVILDQEDLIRNWLELLDK